LERHQSRQCEEAMDPELQFWACAADQRPKCLGWQERKRAKGPAGADEQTEGEFYGISGQVRGWLSSRQLYGQQEQLRGKAHILARLPRGQLLASILLNA